MLSSAVVKIKIDLEFLPGLPKRIIRFQIDFIILDALPESLYENVVYPAVFIPKTSGSFKPTF